MTAQLDKKALLNLLSTENERIMDLLVTFNVPDSIEDPDCDSYLLQNDKTVAGKAKLTNTTTERTNVQVDELQERLNTIKNKLKSKKSPLSDRAKQRREAKKLKKNKEFKKVLVSAAKAIKNENHKQGNIKTEAEYDSKADIKPITTPKTVFNEEGKIVFSKFDFSAHPGAKIKKSHQNPREILKKIKQTDKKINELKEQGDTEKAAEIKNDLAWKKAFDKIEGKKVKDDPKLLYKALKKRKMEKKKSKQSWKDRENKVQGDIQQRQKKREDNIQKRIKDKKNTKLKRLSKKGRVIPGF